MNGINKSTSPLDNMFYSCENCGQTTDFVIRTHTNTRICEVCFTRFYNCTKPQAAFEKRDLILLEQRKKATQLSINRP